MRRVSEIIEAAGGAQAIEIASAGQISRAAVYKWPGIGIPDRHWPVLIRLADTNAEELFRANLAARSQTMSEAAQ